MFEKKDDMVVRPYRPLHPIEMAPGSRDARVLGSMLAMQRLSWEQGVASHAVLDWGLASHARVIAHDAIVRQTSAGKLAEIDDASVVNSASVAEVVLWAATHDDDPAMRAAFDRQIAYLLDDAERADDGTLCHLVGSRDVWVDTVYMVVPTLILAGAIAEARAQFDGHRRRLFDEASGLYGARWSEDEQRVHHPEHWGTGTGWVLAAIARSIRLLGDRDVEFTRELADHARTLIDACLGWRKPDGMFHNVLDDAETFEEGTIAAMLAFTVSSGIVDGWLSERYRPTADSLMATVTSLADADGVVRRVCGSPHFDRQGTSVEAQAFFLLAAAAHRRLELELDLSPTL